MTVATSTTTQVYRVYIKASAEQIWDAITDPEWTNRYGYTGFVHYDLKPGGALKVVPNDEFKASMEAYSGQPAPEYVIEGEVIESDPPRRLVSTWRMLMDPTLAAEPFTRLTYEIKPYADGKACSLTIVHELDGAPMHAALVAGNDDPTADGGGGWAWVLSDLKSLLETGSIIAS
jgi:uncharacterized protein YndB with AHSA1/START domain